MIKPSIYPPPDRAIASRAGLVDVLHAFAAASTVPILLFFLALGACTSDPEPDPLERQVIGSWAGQVVAGGAVLLAEMDLAASKEYQARIRVGGALATREAGAWAVRAGRCYFTPAVCEEADTPGGPLRLVKCGPVDSVAVNISGDTWTANFSAGGELHTIAFKRL